MDHGALDLDKRVSLAAFDFLTKQIRITTDRVLSRTILASGFTFEGTRVPLVGPQGIFKPAILPDMPLSITTAPAEEAKPRPYADEVGKDGLILYRYRGTDPDHRDDVGLRVAMQRDVAPVYLFGVTPARYLAEWPVYVRVTTPVHSVSRSRWTTSVTCHLGTRSQMSRSKPNVST